MNHAARHDELVVPPDECQQLAAGIPKRVQVTEGIGHIGDVSGPVLCNLRIAGDGYRLPIKVAIVLVPMELGDAQEKGIGAVEGRQTGSAIEAEPDLLTIVVSRAIPDLVDRFGLGWHKAICRRSRRLTADIRLGAECAGAWIVDDAVDDAVICIARCDSRSGRLVELAGGDRCADQIFHDDLAPHLGGLKARPVYGGRVG